MKAIFAKLFAPQPHDDWAAVWMITISIVILLLWFASIALILPQWQQ
jgi:hypothetical protein